MPWPWSPPQKQADPPPPAPQPPYDWREARRHSLGLTTPIAPPPPKKSPPFSPTGSQTPKTAAGQRLSAFIEGLPFEPYLDDFALVLNEFGLFKLAAVLLFAISSGVFLVETAERGKDRQYQAWAVVNTGASVEPDYDFLFIDPETGKVVYTGQSIEEATDLEPEVRARAATNLKKDAAGEPLKRVVQGSTGEGGRIKALQELYGANQPLVGLQAAGAFLPKLNLQGWGCFKFVSAYFNYEHHPCLKWADLQGANLEGTSLESINLKGANLSYVNLEGANLSYARLESANLSHTNLESATLDHANLEGAILNKANLEGASLSSTHLESAVLYEANLKGASLSSAHLQYTSLEEAHLEETDLWKVDLKGSSLKSAHLKGASLVTIQGVTEECGFQALKILDWYGLSCFGLRSEG